MGPYSIASVRVSELSPTSLEREELQLTEKEIQTGLALSIRDGFFASVFATLTGGAFLTGFALALGGNALHIGIIAAIPLVGNVFQLVGSYLVSKFGRRKSLSIRSVTVGRLVWILMILLPLTEGRLTSSQMLIGLLGILIVGQAFGAISAVSWLSWISDLVPENFRGRFFGKRNMMVGLAVVCFTLLGGWFLDAWQSSFRGFQALFVVALFAGLVSLRYLQKIPELTLMSTSAKEPFTKTILRPLQERNFRTFLFFTMIWSFGVNLASPFFILYKLRDLQLSYTWVAALVSITALFDLIGMRFWGAFSDRVGNRAVMLMCSVLASLIPLGWVLTSNSTISIYFLMPILHILGGFFWAGMNLASANILFRLAPEEQDTAYFSTYASINGLCAASAALVGGTLATKLASGPVNLALVTLSGLKIVFLMSCLLRCLAIPLLHAVREPKGLPVMKAVQVLRSLRSINSTQGFHPLLHFFISPTARSKDRFSQRSC